MLNEKYSLKKRNLWVNGTTLSRYNKNENTFEKVNLFHPLFFTNNLQYAVEYCKMHTSKDADTNRGTSKYIEAYNNDAVVVFARVRDDMSLFDFTSKEDFEKVGIPSKFQAIFASAEPYFSWNTGVYSNIDERVKEFSIALYWLRKLNSTAGENNKTFYQDTERPIMKILMNASKFTHLTASAYKEFYKHFEGINWTQELVKPENRDKIEWDEERQHHIVYNAKKDQWENVSVAEIPNPDELSQDSIDLVNLYMDFFEEFKKIAAKYGINTFEDTKFRRLRFLLGTPKDRQHSARRNQSNYVDVLQLVIYKKISEKFNGFYCPEHIGKKLYKIEGPVDAICLFRVNPIRDMISFPATMFDRYYKEANLKLGKDKDPFEYLQYVKDSIEKQIADQKAKEEEERRLRNMLETYKAYVNLSIRLPREETRRSFKFVTPEFNIAKEASKEDVSRAIANIFIAKLLKKRKDITIQPKDVIVDLDKQKIVDIRKMPRVMNVDGSKKQYDNYKAQIEDMNFSQIK